MELVLDVGAVAAAGTAILAFAGLLYRAVRPAVRRAAALHELLERELKPNGGGSLRDAVDRIERRLSDHIELGHTYHVMLEPEGDDDV